MRVLRIYDQLSSEKIATEGLFLISFRNKAKGLLNKKQEYFIATC